MKRLHNTVFILLLASLYTYGQNKIEIKYEKDSTLLDASIKNTTYSVIMTFRGYGVIRDTSYYIKENAKFNLRTLPITNITFTHASNTTITGFSSANHFSIEYQNSLIATINGLRAGAIGLFSDTNKHTKLKLVIKNSFIKKIAFSDDYNNFENYFDNFTIEESEILALDFKNVLLKHSLKIKTFDTDTISFENCTLPDTTVLNNISSKGIIDLTLANYEDNLTKVLVIGNVELPKLKIPYDKMTINIDTAQTYENQIMLYQKVLNTLKEQGLIEKFETLDKKYQEVKYKHNGDNLLNLISSVWWDYGYNKSKVFKNSFYLFAAFFLINFILYKKLNIAYLPENIRNYNIALGRSFMSEGKYKQFIVSAYKVFIYTSFIFWGVRLDLKELRLNLWWALLVIIFEYSIGVICLAYIANYIITK